MYEKCLGDSPEAVHFVVTLFGACQVLDDLIDKDEETTDWDITNMFTSLLIEIPRNKFYKRHIDYLTPVLNQVMDDWKASVELEKGDEQKKQVAYILRSTYSNIITHCAYLLGGQERMDYAGRIVRQVAYSETFEEYLRTV